MASRTRLPHVRRAVLAKSPCRWLASPALGWPTPWGIANLLDVTLGKVPSLKSYLLETWEPEELVQ